jgi:hypothetical protein
MFFFFKKKPVYLDCFTTHTGAFHAPVDYSYRFYPDWWKLLEKTVTDEEYGDLGVENPTMKNCVGFIDFFKNSITVPMWSDFSLRLGTKYRPGYNWKFADDFSRIEVHKPMQWGSFFPENKYLHGKFVSPWKFKCKENIYFQKCGPFYNILNPHLIMFPPGLLEFKYQAAVNVNFLLVPQNEECNMFMKYYDPLVHFTPLTERPVKLKIHLVSHEEYEKIGLTFVSFNRNYYKMKRASKNSSVCPFTHPNR